MAHFQHQGAELYYERDSKPGAPALLLLHGGLGSLADFELLRPRLREHFDLIALDSRGHGRSTRGSGPLTYGQLSADARALADQLHLSAYHVLGFSDGGTAAYRLAREDGRVRSLLTIGASWQRPRPAAEQEFFAGLNAAFFREQMAAQVADYEALNPAADLDALSADLVQLWCDESASGYPGDSLATLTVPLLAVRGEDDDLLPLAEWAALRDLLPAAHLLQLPWASHEVLRDQPQLFWSVAQRFYGLTV